MKMNKLPPQAQASSWVRAKNKILCDEPTIQNSFIYFNRERQGCNGAGAKSQFHCHQ